MTLWLAKTYRSHVPAKFSHILSMLSSCLCRSASCSQTPHLKRFSTSCHWRGGASSVPCASYFWSWWIWRERLALNPWQSFACVVTNGTDRFQSITWGQGRCTKASRVAATPRAAIISRQVFWAKERPDPKKTPKRKPKSALGIWKMFKGTQCMDIMSRHVMQCHVMSCHVMQCHVMSCHVMSWNEMKWNEEKSNEMK